MSASPAEVLLPGFTGTTLPDWVAARLRQGMAGVCLFGDNVESLAQLQRLTASILDANPHAVIAIEDKRFYEHEGVDPRGVARAFVQDIIQRKAVQGASTIPQQFVKNALRAQAQRTVFQKLRESAMAFHLSRKWSKEKILTEYLNAIYYGNGAYGIESAARTYFGATSEHFGCGRPENRCASELLPHEAALLAGMVASPSAFDPVVNREAAKRRRNIVLAKMLEQGYITRTEYEGSIRAQLPDNESIHPPQAQAASKSAAYFATWVRQRDVRQQVGLVADHAVRDGVGQVVERADPADPEERQRAPLARPPMPPRTPWPRPIRTTAASRPAHPRTGRGRSGRRGPGRAVLRRDDGITHRFVHSLWRVIP